MSWDEFYKSIQEAYHIDMERILYHACRRQVYHAAKPYIISQYRNSGLRYIIPPSPFPHFSQTFLRANVSNTCYTEDTDKKRKCRE